MPRITLTGMLESNGKTVVGKVTLTDAYLQFDDYNGYSNERVTYKAPRKEFKYRQGTDGNGGKYEILECMTDESGYITGNEFRIGYADIKTWDRKELFVSALYLARPWPRAEKVLQRQSTIIDLDAASQKKLAAFIDQHKGN